MKTFGWVGAGLVVTGCVTWWLLHRGPEREPTRTSSVAGEEIPSHSDRTQIENLDRAIRRLSDRVDRAEALSPQREPAPVAAHAAEDPPDEVQQARARMPSKEWNQLVVTSTLDTLNDALDADTPDLRRSAESALALDTLLSDAEFEGTRAGAVDCTTNLCRFRIQHDSVDARERFRPAMRFAPLKGTTFFHFDRDNLQTLIYVAREGQPLPKADFREAVARQSQ